MDEVFIEQRKQLGANKGLPWHKPQLERLVVSLNTKAEPKGGSASDGGTFDRLIGPPVD